MKINRQDTNGVKPLLAVGEFGYDNYPTGGDAGRVYVGTGAENIPLAKKSEVDAKVVANADITAGTATKVTYDTKGLVTAGTALSAGDIPVLDAGKITTGTLPVVRGGTGTTISTGTGSVVLSTSPVLVTPTIGVATGTSFNSITGLSSTTPVMDGTATIGTGTTVARADHVHPAQTTVTGNAGTATKLQTARTINGVAFDGSANITVVDSTKAPLVSPALTGTPTAPTAAVGTNTTQVATTAFVNAEIANDAVPRVASTANAIVRFDGTTGAVQNSGVIIDDSGNIGSGTQSFNGFGGSGFKNYIINGGFDVWQRGTSQTAGGYGSADRWFTQFDGNCTLAYEQISYNNTAKLSWTSAGTYKNFLTSIEDGARKLQGKTVTMSFIAKAATAGTCSTYVGRSIGAGNSAIIDSVSINLTTSWQKITRTFTMPIYDNINMTLVVGLISMQLSGTSNTVWIKEVQLEEGSVATPFEQRPYGLELSLCQRYYKTGTSMFGDRGIGDIVIGRVEFGIQMRVPPTVTATVVYGGVPTIQFVTSSGFEWYATPTNMAAKINYTAASEL